VSNTVMVKILFSGCVDADAFRGSYAKNPFNFKHFSIRNVSVEVGDEQVPSRNYELDIPNHNYSRSWIYMRL
jgi:hypothetical protein